jgi:hypothetical protein
LFIISLVFSKYPSLGKLLLVTISISTFLERIIHLMKMTMSSWRTTILPFPVGRL